MVRHIVFWNLKDFASGGDKEENAAKIKQGLEGLVGQIEGLCRAEVTRGYDEKNFDLCLYSEFESKQALTFYKNHEKHKLVQRFVHEVITERVACDSEIK